MVASIAVAAMTVYSGPATAAPGSLDPAFGTGGMVSTNSGTGATGVAVVQTGADAGDLAVSGSSGAPSQFQVGMFTASGALNTLFAGAGVINAFNGNALAVAAVPAGVPGAGNVVAAGYEKAPVGSCDIGDQDPVVAEYTPQGAPVFTTDLRSATSRSVTAFLSSGSASVTLTSGTPFTSADIGAAICGIDLPADATIVSVTNGTQAVISGAATTTGTVTVTVSQVNAGQFNSVAIDSSGNIVAAGQEQTASLTSEGLVARLSSSGGLDSTFDGTGYVKTFALEDSDQAGFNSVAVVPPGLPDAGIIMVGGSSQVGASASQLTVAAFEPGGAPDATFNTSGAVQSTSGTVASGITIVTTGSAAGNVVAVGSATSGLPILVQYQPNGTPATSFDGGQVLVQAASGTSDQLDSVAYQPFDGFLALAGVSTETSAPVPQPQTWVVAQYNATSGAPNLAFGAGGLVEGSFGTYPASASAVAAQPDGKTVAAGQAPTVNGDEAIGLIRLLGPTLSVGNLPTVYVTSEESVPMQFTVSVDEPLAVNGCPILAVNGGSALNSPGSCPPETGPDESIPAGQTQVTVTVTVNTSGVLPGSSIEAHLIAESGNGLSASPTNAAGSVIVERVFEVLPGAATDISVGANGAAWVIGANTVPGGYGIFHWTGSGWTEIPGGSVRIAVDPTGNPWVINSAHQIFHWNGSGWAIYPGFATAISVGADGALWAIGGSAAPGGYGIFHSTGSGWTEIPGGAVRIAVDPTGNPWVINSAHTILTS